MAILESEDLDKILAEIEPDHIPAEFISSACVTDLDDEVFIITREELEEIMGSDATLEEQGIAEIGFILNISEIKDTIRHYAEIILKDIAL